MGLHILHIDEILIDDDMQHGVEQRHIGAGLNCSTGWRGDQTLILSARIHHNQFCAALGGRLDVGGGDRVIFRRPCADHDHHLGILRGGEGRTHRARIQPFHQRSD